MRVDYSHPDYGLESSVAAQVALLQRLPCWERRKYTKTSPRWSGSRHLYRYMRLLPGDQFSEKKARESIAESLLYLAAPSDFNDPYDFRAYVSFSPDPQRRRRYFEKSARIALEIDPSLGGHLRTRSKKIEFLVQRAMDNAAQPGFAMRAFLETRERMGVACFAKSPRNTLMWAHYAAGHTGVCVQYEAARCPGTLLLGYKVSYGEALPHLVWPEEQESIVDVALRKSKHWETEDEIRYLSLSVNRRNIQLDPTALTGLVLGGRFSESQARVQLLREILVKRATRGFPIPRIYKVSRDERSYALRISRSLDLLDR